MDDVRVGLPPLVGAFPAVIRRNEYVRPYLDCATETRRCR